MYPHSFFAQLEKNLHGAPSRESNSGLPTELRRTSENNCSLWNRLFDADFTVFFLKTCFFSLFSGGIFSREGLSRLWNQLVRDGELVDETLFKQR
jgi:hypothetical protein